MELVKARLGPDQGEPVTFLFNPAQYGLEQGNQFAEIGIPGLGAPLIQYVRGGGRTVSMELFFDTYAKRDDVRNHTNEIYKLLAIEGEKHAPPICRFEWGEGEWSKRGPNSFLCVVERVSGQFTMFLENGTPVRATLNVSLREYVDVESQVKGDDTRSADHVKTRAVMRGDTLSSIAAAEYGDAGKWRPIAAANGIENPRRLPVGTVLVIPPLVGGAS